MPFVRSESIEGLVYVPECQEGCVKKHNCTDCFSCQFCSDARCDVCLKKNSKADK